MAVDSNVENNPIMRFAMRNHSREFRPINDDDGDDDHRILERRAITQPASKKKTKIVHSSDLVSPLAISS